MWYKLTVLSSSLVDKLKTITPELANAAQSVYDDWELNEEGFSESYGSGGICDDIADEMLKIIYNKFPDLQVTTIYIEEPGHTYCIVYDSELDEAAEVDISPYLYEQGSYYTWKKIPNVIFTPDFVSIHRMNSQDAKTALNNDGF